MLQIGHISQEMSVIHE